jgi:hypothetical protein
VGDAFGVSSVTTRLAHAVRPSCASVVVNLVIGSDSAVRAFQPLVLALRTLVLVIRTHMLLARGATLRPLSLVIPQSLGVGLRSCAARPRLQHHRQCHLQGVVRSSMSTPIWTRAFSASLL